MWKVKNEYVRLNLRVSFKKPCHVGYGVGKQIRDFSGRPFVPFSVLRSQFYCEALRFSSCFGVEVLPPKVSDGYTPEKGYFTKIMGKEFFKNTIYFWMRVRDVDLPFYLAAVRSIKDAGLGACTSLGFGYNDTRVLNWEILENLGYKCMDIFGEGRFFEPRFFTRLATKVVEKLKLNWKSWSLSYGNVGSFKLREYYKVFLDKVVTSSRFRSLLRKRLAEIYGVKHSDGLTCKPKEEPCKVCRLLGCPSRKSRVIVREFRKREEGRSEIYLICENPTKEEVESLRKVLREEGLKNKLIRKASLKDYFRGIPVEK